MGIFGPDPEEEMQDIIEDIIDLHEDMNGKSNEELAKSHSGYERAYKKILNKLRDYYNRDILGSGPPEYLEELINEIESPQLVLKTTTITRIKMGIKKISRKLKIELPEKKELTQNHLQLPQQVIQFNANPTMSTQVNISNETTMKIENLINDFKKELNIKNPDKNNLWELFKKILKLLGFLIG